MPRTPRIAASSSSVVDSSWALLSHESAVRRRPAWTSTKPSSRWASTAVARSPAASANWIASCSTTAPSSSRPRAAWTRAPPSAARVRARSAVSRHRAASAAAVRRHCSPASTAPATIAARPASSWLTAAARPFNGGTMAESGPAPAASRRAARLGPSSRRSRSSQTATWRRAAVRSPVMARHRTSSRGWSPPAGCGRPPRRRTRWRPRRRPAASSAPPPGAAGPRSGPTTGAGPPATRTRTPGWRPGPRLRGVRRRAGSSGAGSALGVIEEVEVDDHVGAERDVDRVAPQRAGRSRARRSSARVQRSAPSGSSASRRAVRPGTGDCGAARPATGS